MRSGAPGRRRDIGTTARLARGPSTGTTTTARFSSTPTGTAPRAFTTGRCGRAASSITWIRVSDLAASKQFYVAIGPHARFRLKEDAPDRCQFVGESGSFSVVAGTPTEHVHLAFPTTDDAAVEAFHRAATEAGYRDNGPPRERPIYHPGYYGAYVLDPDGNNVEVVNHHRRA